MCFVEDYSYISQRGCISAYEIDAEGYRELGPVVDEPFHLSYPFLIEYENQLYMCPETNRNKDIRLYRCEDFPGKWVYHKTLIENVVASDTNIFRKGNKWWMMTNIDSSALGDNVSEVHIFYSDAPDSNTWTPHSKNPVIFDSGFARNGGLIVEGEKVFRVFQKQGFDMYGQAMGVSLIEGLSDEDYRESVVFEIPPKFFKGISGTHSLAYKDGLLAIDFVKRERYNT